MAALFCNNRLLLVTLVLLCFFSVTAISARNLRVVRKEIIGSGEQNKLVHDDQNQQKPEPNVEDNHQEMTESISTASDLLTMDYTPARKKPPIHN